MEKVAKDCKDCIWMDMFEKSLALNLKMRTNHFKKNYIKNVSAKHQLLTFEKFNWN